MKMGTKKTLILIAIILLFVVILGTQCTTTVPTGYTAIITTFGRVEETTLEAGFHLKSPFQQIVLMDNREQKTDFVTQAFSSDIQQVDISGSVNYSINKSTAMHLFQEVGVDYFNKLIYPRMLENTKAVFSKYTAENLVYARETLSVQVRDKLSEELDKYGINIISLSIENIDFTDAFTDAVENKQVAAQKKLQAEIEQEQKTMESKQQAERDRIKAEAEASVIKINADAEAYSVKINAEAQAEANRQIAASITDGLITYTQMSRWDGKLPNYVSGSASEALPILNVTDSLTDDEPEAENN